MPDLRRKRRETGAKTDSHKHPGVVLMERRGRWVVRYTDPDETRVEAGGTRLVRTQEAIPGNPTRPEAVAWAAKLSGKLAERRRALEGGAARKTGRTLVDVVESYFTDHAGHLRARTVTAYRVAARELLEFAEEHRVTTADALRPETLTKFRAWLRGGRRASRSVVTSNQRLRSLRTVLTELRRAGLVPMLSSDDIKDRLRSEEEPDSPPEPLSQHDARALLRAAMRHDAARFTVTRDENRAGGQPGNTPKHDPVGPFVLFVLLTGMRRDEARLLRWDRVDLHHEPKGAVKLRPEDVKTKRGRLVDLKVCPTLHELLTAMRLKAGDREYVFTVPDKDGNQVPRSEEQVKFLRERLQSSYAAPEFSWQRLRDTAATYLVNASVFGHDTLRRAPRQLGHTVSVAESKYWDVVNVAPAATLEAALGVEAEARAVVRQAMGERIDEEAMKAPETATA